MSASYHLSPRHLLCETDEKHIITSSVEYFSDSSSFPSLFQGMELVSGHSLGFHIDADTPNTKGWNGHGMGLLHDQLQDTGAQEFPLQSSSLAPFRSGQAGDASLGDVLGLGVHQTTAPLHSAGLVASPLRKSGFQSFGFDGIGASPSQQQQQQHLPSSNGLAGGRPGDDESNDDADSIDDVLRLQPWLLE